MIDGLTQADIGKSMKVSSMTVSRVMRSLNSQSSTSNEADVLKTLIVGELQKRGFTLSVCLELISEVASELQYLLKDSNNLCWIIFVETQERSFRMTALNASQLQAMVDALGMVLVLPLHRIVEDARMQLARIEAAKRAARKGAAA